MSSKDNFGQKSSATLNGNEGSESDSQNLDNIKVKRPGRKDSKPKNPSPLKSYNK